MSPLSPRRKRQLASGLLGLVLISSALGATVVVGAERTVLDAETVKDSMESEDAYEAFATDVVGNFQADAASAGDSVDLGGSDAPAVEDVARSVVTPAYVQSELDASIDSLYAYLHGERDDIALRVDLRPVHDGFAMEYEEWVREASVDELEPETAGQELGFSMAALAESESSFRETRTAFEEDQLDRIQERTPRERSREELEALYDDYRADIRDELHTRLEDAVAEQDTPEPLREPVVAYGSVGVDALVAEETSYDAFMADEDAAREDLAVAVGDTVGQMMADELPQAMDLTGEMDQQARDDLSQARTAVSITSALVYALPIVALVAAGLLLYVARRRSNGLWRIGGGLAAAGLLGFLTATLLSEALSRMLPVGGTDLPAVGAAMLAVVDTTISAISTQSLVVLGLGVVLVVIGVAVRRDLLPIEDEPGGPAGE